MQDGLTFMVQQLLVQLPGDDAAERELAGLVSDEWLHSFASFRFLGGSQLASLYARPMLPQPRANDIARTFLREQMSFGCFDGIDVLYPDGDAELVNVVWRYSG
jgi:hypothetical protein